MPAHPLQNNFTSGEISPRMRARVDLDQYRNGCETLENFLVLPQGGATRRPGMRFVAETKFSAKESKLIPFKFALTDNYIIEAGDLYFRFYRNNARIEEPAGTPIEVVTPYTEAQLPDLRYAQSADTLYLAHPSHAPRKLIRTSHTVWTLRTINFLPPPTYEPGISPVATLTPGATTGNGVTFTASAASFLAGDVGRELKIIGGTSRAVIRTFSSTTVVTADIIDAFPDTNPIASQSWLIDRTPATTCDPSGKGPAHSIITLTLGLDGWRTTDVGKYVKVQGGVAKITAVTSSTVVSAEILSPLTSDDVAGAGTWTLEHDTWTTARGFPRTVEFFEQRQWWAGTATQPTTVWSTVTSDFENLAAGTLADAAVEYTIASQQLNGLRWMLATDRLMLGTAGSEMQLTGGADNDPITPTNVQARGATNLGSSAVIPVRVGADILFNDRTGRQVHNLAFSFKNDNLDTIDLSVISEHILAVGVKDMAYQQSPDPVVWLALKDGTLVSLTYLPKQEVIAWARHITQGTV